MDERKPRLLAGWMMIGMVVIGILGILGAFLSLLFENDYIGMGLCLLASAYAFGGVLKAYR